MLRRVKPITAVNPQHRNAELNVPTAGGPPTIIRGGSSVLMGAACIANDPRSLECFECVVPKF
jgi:hypothetical protein